MANGGKLVKTAGELSEFFKRQKPIRIDPETGEEIPKLPGSTYSRDLAADIPMDAEYKPISNRLKKGMAAGAVGAAGLAGLSQWGPSLEEGLIKPDIKGAVSREEPKEPKDQEEEPELPSRDKDREIPDITSVDAIRTALPKAQDFSEEAEDLGLLDDEFKKQLGAAQEMYRNTTDKLASRELWESIVNGLGYLAAGAYGMTTGANIQGLKFDKTDWEAKRANALSELEQAQNIAAKTSALDRQQILDRVDAKKDKFNMDKVLFDAAINKAYKNAALGLEERKLRADETALGLKQKATAKGSELKELEETEKRINQLRKEVRAAQGTGKDVDPTQQALLNEIQQYEQLAKQSGITPKFTVADMQEMTDPWFGKPELAIRDPEDFEKARGQRLKPPPISPAPSATPSPATTPVAPGGKTISEAGVAQYAKDSNIDEATARRILKGRNYTITP